MCKKNYDWQKIGFNKIDELMAKDENSIVPLNACVGSGKTNVMFYAIKHFIDLNPDRKTVSFFVAPTIRLTQQQMASAEKFFSGNSPINNINYTEKKPTVDNCKSFINCVEWDCTTSKDSKDRKVNSDIYPETQHLILFVCADSYMGTVTEGDHKRDNSLFWLGKLKYWTTCEDSFMRRLIGVEALDEAHNYATSQEKLFGRKVSEIEEPNTEEETPELEEKFA